MVFVGIYGAKRTKNISEFFLGGRNVGPWISAFAYGTTYFSAVVFIGYAGKFGWDIGIGALWIGLGNAFVGCLAAWFILAKKTRTMTHRLGTSTMPEFLESRYSSPVLKLYSALIIFIFLIPYATGVYKGLGTMFNSVFPSVDVTVWMAVIAILTAIYLVLGGYVSTAINDFIQGIIMIFGVIIMIVMLFRNPEVGGVSNWLKQLGVFSEESGKTLTSWYGGSSWSFLITNIILTSIGTWGLPQMVHKFYAIKDESSIKKATIISTVFAFIIGVGAYLTGTMGRFFIQPDAAGLPSNGGFDNVMPQMLMKVFSGNVGGNIILSVVLLLLLSASMSTLASVVLTSSSAISIDILKAARPKLNDKVQMIVMRLLCFTFVGLSFWLATQNFTYIVNLMSFSWGIVAGSFIGPYVWGLYSKKVTKAAAWVGTLSGLVVVGSGIIYYTVKFGEFNVALMNPPLLGALAIFASLISVPVVSLFTKKFSPEFNKKVFGE